MADQVYTASKSRAQGRPGWTISFRHPLRPDTKGKPGLKMRRGLDTRDADEADAMVAEMNVILGDPSWWNAVRRAEAEQKFAAPIVAAFFDEIQAGKADPWALRESYIELPTAADGYARALLIGTTGAGKTTLLRHLIGSDPNEDRFPSTSTAKTTISDIECVLAETSYSAVVTFTSEFAVQASVEECVADACSTIWEGGSDAKVMDRLLNHRDQKFRLGYALGSWSEGPVALAEDEWDFGGHDEIVDADIAISDEEKTANKAALRDYLARLKALSNRIADATAKEIGQDFARLGEAEREGAQEMFEERLQADDAFVTLVHDIVDDLRRRFEFIRAGELETVRSGWPSLWRMETDSRTEFIRQIRWFSSNYAPHFGRLLTPLVDGIRVRGPLFPGFSKEQPKLVLLDGQGLGHTPDSSVSLTTQITRRFADVDVILLVDNAQNPMQAAPLSVLRAVAASGHQRKLAIALTHFDQVKGVNLPTMSAKRAHVMASVANALTILRDILGATVVRSMERSIDQQCFLLGAMDQPSNLLPKGVVAELGRMLAFFRKSIEPEEQPSACPIYSPDGLVLAVQSANRGFFRPWLARLGLAPADGIHKEHFMRIKALNRRIAGELSVEYDTLRPVADLLARTSEEISRYLDNPTRWEPRVPSDEEAEAALSAIRKQVYGGLHALAERRLIQDHLGAWRSANEFRGRGSTFERAQEIQTIYEAAAPVPSSIVTTTSAAFMKEVRELVHQAIKDNGGAIDANVGA